jgi:hypothetical protein
MKDNKENIDLVGLMKVKRSLYNLERKLVGQLILFLFCESMRINLHELKEASNGK